MLNNVVKLLVYIVAVLLVYIWFIYGLCMVYVWFIYGLFIGFIYVVWLNIMVKYCSYLLLLNIIVLIENLNKLKNSKLKKSFKKIFYIILYG